MHEKARDLADACVRGRLGRRELMRRLSALGLTAGAAGAIPGGAAGRAMAAEFDWKKYSGRGVKLLLNKHPYADALIADLDAFKQMSGINAAYDVFPEDVYFDKVTAALSSRSTEYDAFMTGAYQTWQYGPAGWLVDLNEYIKDPGRTAPDYDWEDVLPNLRASTAWSGKPGDALGGAGAKQWCVPMGFEIYSLSYNRPMLGKLKVGVPRTLPELMEAAAKVTKDSGGPYGVGMRVSRSWATIHPGFLSGFTNYGGKDFVSQDGKLRAAMNSPEAKEFTALWVKMIQQSGPKNWATYTLVPGRHRSRRRRVGDDLRRRHPRLLHGRRRQPRARPHRLRADDAEPEGADLERVDLVAGDVEFLAPEGRRLGLHAVGHVEAARAVRRAGEGPRQPGAPERRRRRRVPAAAGEVLSRLQRPIQGHHARREDLLHAAATVLQRHHRTGGGVAAHGGEPGAGERGPGPARRLDRQMHQAGIG